VLNILADFDWRNKEVTLKTVQLPSKLPLSKLCLDEKGAVALDRIYDCLLRVQRS